MNTLFCELLHLCRNWVTTSQLEQQTLLGKTQRVIQFCGFFKKVNAEICFAELVASQEVRLQRNVMESRLQAKASKRDIEWSTKNIFETDKRFQCVSNDGEFPFENYIKIDNTDLPPETAAEMIKVRFAL